ncbi:hypothetical protein FBU30_009776 [Linnemannia zychae]|nr:hypothetical protein FBU30_009776 [Linnemannia zychae]
MRSSLGSQISFQLTNENLPFDPDTTGSPLQVISTNTAAAAEAGSTGLQFNQLFNYVNLIDEVTIAAGETEYVILGFLPEPRSKNRRVSSCANDGTNNSGNGSAFGDGVQVYDDSRQRDISANGLANGSNIDADEFNSNDQQTDSFDSFEVNGLVFFFAYKLNTLGKGITSSGTSTLSHTEPEPSESPPSTHTSGDLLPGPTSTALSTGGGNSITGSTQDHGNNSTVSHSTTPHKADYQYTVKFRSTVCRSVLYSNIGETGINFEDCVTNQEYVKDFTIWNRSEIPLYWQLNTVDVGGTSRENWLHFVDYEDSFGGVGAEDGAEHVEEHSQRSSAVQVKPIPSYGYRRIRVIFRPKENGDFLFDLLLENLNDASNIEEATIHAAVRAVSRGEDTLTISTGSTMDFGDCCAGVWTRLPLTFSNTGLTPTEIHLKVEGAEVVFDIQTEAGTELPESSSDPSKDGKFVLDPDIQSSWYESSRRSDSSSNTDHPDQSNLGGQIGRSRLRDWVEDGPQSPNVLGFTSSAPSVADSAGTKGDRAGREQGLMAESGPSSPVLSDGFFPNSAQPYNATVASYLAGQELARPLDEANEDEGESEVDTTSIQDSLTTSNMITPKKRHSLRSISFSGAQREKEMMQAQIHAPKSPIHGNQSTTRIEELFVKPGKERTVIVSYRPARDASIEDFQAGKLLRKSFRIIVAYAPWGGLTSTVPFSENAHRDRKIIQCKARACTSFVTFEPKVLDFGDTDVGALKSLPIKLMNQSEIPAVVQLDFQSKVLNCSPSGAITLAPKSSTELKLDIYPRKVNPDYRKQLTLFNFTNRANDQIIEVRSTNIDKNRVTFHSLFYRVLYPGGTNFLDFGNVVVGGISLRIITISNFTKSWLTLEVTTSLFGELSVYERAREHRDYLNLDKISNLLSNVQEISTTAQVGSRSVAHSPVVRPGVLPAVGSGRIVPNDGSKSTLNKRRQEQREHSAATSDSGTPVAIGGSPLASSLALKAKAILFHGDVSQGISSNSAGFLDLATNKPREVKKITRRIPTMKELLEPSSRPKGKSTSERPGKTSGIGLLEISARSPRSNGIIQQSTSTANSESSKRSDMTMAFNQRQQDPKLSQSEGVPQTNTDGKNQDHLLENSITLENVLAAMDTGSSAGGSMLFYKPADEERYVKERMKQTRVLQNAITSGELAPISMVSVPPETEHQLIVLFTPSSTFRDHIKGIPKNQDARIYLRLVDFDQETVANNSQFKALLDGDLSRIPLREIMVRSSLVRSIMDLGQNNINFGNMDRGEKRTKTIVIQNRSKEPLLYHIRKSGSIASGDIVLGNGKSGVVRGYSKKEVDFIFEPSMSGLYHERLAIENIQDPESSRVLSVKANIRKPKHFSIDCPEVDFGNCVLNQKSEPKRITVTNSTKQTRTFEVRVDPHEMMPLAVESHFGGEIEFTLEDDPAGQAVVTKEMEDEIEILEQKLKIAKRKGREDKVKKVTARLSLLRKGGVEDKVESPKPSDDATPTQEKVLELAKADQIGSPTVDSVKGTASSTPTSATPATTPIIKDIPKFKRTDHSIVFTLEGGKTKSVSAYFTALLDPAYVSDNIINKERTRLQGKIYVHEHKNRDICRDVMFTATVEPLTPSESNAEKEPRTSITPGLTDSDNTLKIDNMALATKEAQTEKSNKETTVGVVAIDDQSMNKLEPPVEHLILSPTEFDGGRVELDQKSNFYFKLSNSSESPLPFQIELNNHTDGSLSRFIMEEHELKGILEAKEVRRITFGYLAHELGKLQDSLRVINQITQLSHEFVFTCYSHRAQYLAFPSLDESLTLDLGYCYVDAGRKYSQVTPLLVENITDDDIYISCASNLAQQVGIYLDEQAEKGQVTKTLLKKKSMVTVWVAVQPNLLGGIAGGNSSRRAATSAGGLSSTTQDRDNECRTLVGGIKFSISIPDGAITTLTTGEGTEETFTQALSQTVKFTSVIGRSILSVSDILLNLGWTPEVGRPVYGSFTLQNMSNRLPLDFKIESLSGNIILDRTGGILDGWEVDAKRAGRLAHMNRGQIKAGNEGEDDNDASEVAPTDRSRLWISFRVTASTPGLLSDTILVTNKNNCSQKIYIKVRLFVDPGRLSTIMHGPGYTCPMAVDDSQEDAEIKPGIPREGLTLPSLSWENVYVSVTDEEDVDGQDSRALVTLQPQLGQENDQVDIRWINLLNDSDEVMELVPLCDINADTRWEPTNSSLPIQVLDDAITKVIDGFHSCGSIIRLAPGQEVHLAVSCPSPELSASDVQQLQTGKNVSLMGTLMVVDRLHNQVMKVLGLSSSFGVSYAEVLPLSTDLGKIGHYNSWNPVKITFEVKNSSEIPLYYEIVLQDSMYLAPSQPLLAEVDQSLPQPPLIIGNKRKLISLGTDLIEVLLNPRKIENFEIGRRTFAIHILNLYNPLNEPIFNVSAVLTEFELEFERLTDGTLILPPLTHPLPSSALPCDAWFSITNKSLEDVKFEIGANLSPDVVDYVHLDVLSRFSNSPLRGSITLSPRGSIGVRIRAFPKEGSRLPSDTSALCIPEGLTFGELWVSTKAMGSDEELSTRRFAQNIPIRGTLVEGSMFSLSTQRIVFRSLMETSDSENDSNDEQLSGPDSVALLPPKESLDDSMSSEVQKATITVSNLSMTFPLEFQMTLEGPMEYPAAEIIRVMPLDSNNCGVIEAGQQLKLVVELLDPHLIISEDIKLYIRNLNSKLGQQQRVLISLVSDNREHRKSNKKHAIEDERIDPHHHQNKLEELPTTNINSGLRSLENSTGATETDTSNMQPIILLRGCKRIDSSDSAGGRYELDLGQQDIGSSNVIRKLVLENSGYDRVSYRIKTISALDRNWIKISRTEGTLEPPSEEQLSTGSSSIHTITLAFVTNVRNVFSTYLLIENMDNPGDTKTIRVTMEVVARQNLRRATKGNEGNNRVFDVLVNGIDQNSSTIDMKNLFYGSEYTARSMVVYNRESVPMEFTFKSNLSPSDNSEILFSTSRTSAKLFKTLTVPSENHVRVYIRFFPRPSAAIQAALDNGESRAPDEMELKTVEIYINCRLVKDYQQVVTLTAECYMPAFRVDWDDSVSFVARLSRESSGSAENAEEWKLSFQEEFRILGISNMLQIPLDYEIVNDTMYFNLEYPEPDKILDGLEKHEIRIVPNIKALLRNAENFRREKYVQENITIYNRNRPLENYWIPLRLSFGNVSNFQLSSGYKSSYAFGMIEQHVVNFLSDFNSHAVLVNMGSSCFPGAIGASSGLASSTGSNFSLPSVGLGPDRSSSPNSNHSSPMLLGNSLTTLISPPSTGPVAGMLGLGRSASSLVAANSSYHPPSHHPHYHNSEAQETQRKLIDLEFQYHYVVDQLVYYSTIKTGENFFQLASLLFCSLLNNRIFQIWSPSYLKDPRVSTATVSMTGGSGSGTGSGSAGMENDEYNERKSYSAGSNGFANHSHNGNYGGAQQHQLSHSLYRTAGQDESSEESSIRVWPQSLKKWVEALDYFVSKFVDLLV